MTTKKLVEWLDSKIHISFLPRVWNDADREMLKEVIKRLEEHQEQEEEDDDPILKKLRLEGAIAFIRSGGNK